MASIVERWRKEQKLQNKISNLTQLQLLRNSFSKSNMQRVGRGRLKIQQKPDPSSLFC
jgi:hypothetical protein